MFVPSCGMSKRSSEYELQQDRYSRGSADIPERQSPLFFNGEIGLSPAFRSENCQGHSCTKKELCQRRMSGGDRQWQHEFYSQPAQETLNNYTEEGEQAQPAHPTTWFFPEEKDYQAD